ncbi:hypothetical protein BRAS3843_1940020 [Bradyrhizobium sp. STM 3843]|nr:hypothetical protein BRAS3843_1940020 [Bradyrhizobium sp. STM 3843]
MHRCNAPRIPFSNIRFVSNAVVTQADAHYHKYLLKWNQTVPKASSATAGKVSISRDGSLGGVNGPFVAESVESLYSPWVDRVHDCRWHKISLRERHRRSRRSPVSDPASPAQVADKP